MNMARKTAGKERPEEVAKEDSPRMKIAGDLPLLETNIDELYELVKKAKSITFLEAAKDFDVDREQIAVWAKILEDHKLAKVHYPIFGSPVIFSMDSIVSKKSGKASKEEEKEKPGKKAPKIVIALLGGLMVFFGYVMFVSNPFTITLRSNLASVMGRFTAGLRYPFNIIIPVAIIIAVIWAIASLKRRHKPGKGGQKEKQEKRKKKPNASKDEAEDRLERIKKELGS
jgi:hypothetical protein